eukprot:jgi/Bigna1/136363/aug1.33_g11071
MKHEDTKAMVEGGELYRGLAEDPVTSSSCRKKSSKALGSTVFSLVSIDNDDDDEGEVEGLVLAGVVGLCGLLYLVMESEAVVTTSFLPSHG